MSVLILQRALGRERQRDAGARAGGGASRRWIKDVGNCRARLRQIGQLRGIGEAAHLAGQQPGQFSLCLGKTRSFRDRLFQQMLSFGHAFQRVAPVQDRAGAQEQVERVRVLCAFSQGCAAFDVHQRHAQSAGQTMHDGGLRFRQMVTRHFKTLGPEMGAGFRIDQLGVDGKAVLHSA